MSFLTAINSISAHGAGITMAGGTRFTLAGAIILFLATSFWAAFWPFLGISLALDTFGD